MEPLTIALIALVAAAVWAVVELALVFRRARRSVGELTESANGVIEEARPVIAKIDGAVDELTPATKHVDPILEKAATSVDLLNVNLVRLETILSDVTVVTDTGARAAGAVSGAADAVASGVAGVVGKLGAKLPGSRENDAKLAPGTQADEPASLGAASDAATPSVEKVSGDAGYFTYPQESGAAGPGPHTPESPASASAGQASARAAEMCDTSE